MSANRTILTLFFLLAVTLLMGQVEEMTTPVVRKAVFFDKTEPLRDMKVVLRGSRDRSWKNGVIDNKSMDESSRYRDRGLSFEDVAIQKSMGTKVSKGPMKNIPGIGKTTSTPSDSDGDISPDHYFQMVNLSFAIWDRQGNLLYGPVDNSTLWDGFIGSWTGTNDGDPIVLFDDLANRWIATQFAVETDDGTFWQLIAVSETSDPLGAYFRYAFQFEMFNDYPKFSVWPDGYYSTYNMFENDFEGAIVAVMDREAMIAGDPDAQIVLFGPFPEQYSVKSAHLEGMLPPDGSPNWLVNLKKYGQQSLEVYKLRVDWANPLNSTYDFVADLPVIAFDFFNPGVREQLPQPNTDQLLDPLSKYLMNPLQYRNFGSHQSMVVNHTVKVGDVAGVRWYELRNDAGAEDWYIHQQGTYCPEDGLSRWMGSIAINANGEIALGYSVTGSTLFPSVAYTGQTEGAPPGEMNVEEMIVVEGTHSQTSSARWGDYSAMAIDPVNDTTFWYTAEYMPSSGWGTRIISFDFGPVSPPVAYAGPDSEICTQQVFYAQGNASGQKSVLWESTGDGNLFNANSLSPAYLRGASDLENGEFELIMTAYGFESGLEASDTVYVAIVEDVFVSLGNDTTIQINNSLQLFPEIVNADSLLWRSSGDGSFSNDTVPNPVYTPGPLDIENREVIISLFAKAFEPCSGEDEDQMTLFLDEQTNLETINQPHVVVYPVPSNGVLNVEISELPDQDCVFRVFSENGQVVFSEKLSSYKGQFFKSLNFNNLPDGTYFVSVDTKTTSIIRRIILKR